MLEILLLFNSVSIIIEYEAKYFDSKVSQSGLWREEIIFFLV